MLREGRWYHADRPGAPAGPSVPHSSRGPGHRPLKAEITGSNPVCGTKSHPGQRGHMLPAGFPGVGGISTDRDGPRRTATDRDAAPPGCGGLADGREAAALARLGADHGCILGSNVGSANIRGQRSIATGRSSKCQGSLR